MTAVADPIIVTEAAANKITQLLDEEKKKDGRKVPLIGQPLLP